jgi:bifunctional non-homologous end joining protein LigD
VGLREYQKKRDFTRTREPKPDADASTGQRPLFVVQLHHASTRHFDFRLQVGQTLKSWAVPKGPSYDPKIKRLAVEVEDHPLAYADFEGDIEHGYGKGHVDRFDRGVWSTERDPRAQLRKGHLRFELFGKRLKGEWHLVRSAKRNGHRHNWLLFKANDAYASDIDADALMDDTMRESTRRAARTPKLRAAARKATAHKRSAPKRKSVRAKAALIASARAIEHARAATPSPAFFKPELTLLRQEPPSGDQWLHEVKWDGYRILATIAHGEVALWSRNALYWDDKVPDIKQAVESLGLDSARLDGELIATDEQGRSDFNRLQKILSGEAAGPLVYVLFDLPYFEGYDLSRASLVARKELLARVLKSAHSHLALSTHTRGDGEAAFQRACEHQLEGIVSKRCDAGYHAGRSGDWIKVKRLSSDEFAVIGYTSPKGRRRGFGSLLLAKPDPARRGGWMYVGRVGTGFNDQMLAEVSERLGKQTSRKPPTTLSHIDPLLKGSHWVPPRLVAEVYYRGIGSHQLLRQPSLKALRMDKNPRDLKQSDRATSSRPKATHSAGGIAITHADRVVYPDDGITKGDVATYYRTVMSWLLPGLQQRPVSVIRCPEGTAKACFFQKHPIQGLHRVGVLELKEESGTERPYMYVKDADSVLELVQFGTLEFHIWGSTVKQPEKTDQIVFDLDPAPDVAWPRVVAAARTLKRMLETLDLQSFVRTSGGKGLHVVVPLHPRSGWQEAKDFSHAVASTLTGISPGEFIDVATKQRRKGKIFIDYLRNNRGATSVANYSLRSHPGAPVATPLRWEELGRLKGSDAYDMHTLPKRLVRMRKDPWEHFDTVKQTLRHALKTLARLD